MDLHDVPLKWLIRGLNARPKEGQYGDLHKGSLIWLSRDLKARI
jgi:hypothetical protein